MKKIKLLLSLCLLLVSFQAMAQTAAKTDTLAPYLKNPTLPAFFILKADSSSAINTYDIPEGQYTILMFFSPDCEHCKQLTKQMTASQAEYKDVAFYLFTPMQLGLLREFIADQHLDKYDNFFAGKDMNFFFPGFYRTKYVPHLVVYDEHKKLVTSFMGNFKWAEVEAVLAKRPKD